MSVQVANALWEGTLKTGKGVMKYGEVVSPFTFASRFEDGDATNPEELIGAAHSGCFSMFLAALLSEKGLTPTVQTQAKVHLGDEDGPKINHIELSSQVTAEGLTTKFHKPIPAVRPHKM